MHKMIISFFALTCMLTCANTHAHAQKRDANERPATHMWLRAGDNMVFVPLRSEKQCEIYTRHAADLNSSESNCYNRENLIKKIKCIKPLKDGETPRCS